MSVACISPRTATSLALAATALRRALSPLWPTRLRNPRRKCAHRSGCHGCPRSPSASESWLHQVRLFETNPVIARRPPRTSCNTIELSEALSWYRYNCTTNSEPGRKVVGAGAQLDDGAGACAVVSRSPWLSASPSMVFGNCPGDCATAAPWVNSTFQPIGWASALQPSPQHTPPVRQRPIWRLAAPCSGRTSRPPPARPRSPPGRAPQTPDQSAPPRQQPRRGLLLRNASTTAPEVPYGCWTSHDRQDSRRWAQRAVSRWKGMQAAPCPPGR